MIAGQKAKRNPLYPASTGRQALAKGLEQMPTGKWIAIRDFFKFLPNLELALTTQTIAPSDKLIVDRFCDQTSDNLWTLSKIKILNLLEQGMPLEEIENQLVALSVDQGFPPIFRTFFDDLKKKNGQLSKRGSYVLIECQDAHLALLLANDRELKKFTFLVPERQLIVLNEREEHFRRHVKKLGYFLPSKTSSGG